MHIISQKKLKEFVLMHPGARTPCDRWYKVFTEMPFDNIMEVKAYFPSVDHVAGVYVFNLGGNNYRLVAKILFKARRVYIRAIMTHAEYSKDRWEEDPWISKQP